MSAQIKFSDLMNRKPLKVLIGESEVCVVRVEEEVFAVADTCSHSDASLSEGDVNEFKIECWLHGAEFDLRTGAVVTPPATQPLKKYEVLRDGDAITIMEPGR
ncbi:MAG: Rieske 2Fe-2S domain-containing protein [Actinomycetota bacterium]|jgi:3-phenylpropionate/trans-cinnamate dioxygenase ferredoxin subunit